MNFKTRWCLQSDIPQLIEIENLSYLHPWNHEDFSVSLRKDDHVGVVLEVDKKIVGYLIYQSTKTVCNIIGLAIHPDNRKKGGGKFLLDYLKKKYNKKKVFKIKISVSDTMLDAHNFLKSMGFVAVRVLKNHFGPSHDGYEFLHTATTPLINKKKMACK
jgi:[ribosomal protein S18]-alanine N-acetyltransferase